MTWQESQAHRATQPPYFDQHTAHYPLTSPDEKYALGLETQAYGISGPSSGIPYTGPIDYTYDPVPDSYYDGPYNSSAIALDPGYDEQYVSPPHRPYPAYTSPLQPSHVPIPSMMPFPPGAPAYAPAYAHPLDWQRQVAYDQDHSQYYPYGAHPHRGQLISPVQQAWDHQPVTISPTALASARPVASRSFGDLMASRGSISSSDSGGSAGIYDDLARPLQQALGLEVHPPANDFTTIPEPAARRYTSPVPQPPSHQLHPPVPLPPANLNDAMLSYVYSPNRLAQGERKIMVMSPKVGQKSYGNEKRFICPHPQAILIGSAWWRRISGSDASSPVLPPRVNISLLNEGPVGDSMVTWTTVDGRVLDDLTSHPMATEADVPFFGTAPGRNLHISESDGKKKEVKALVTVKAPLRPQGGPSGTRVGMSNEEIVGTFESKPITVISKPSKKKGSSKSSDMVIQHGSTVAIFNRVKSQTSTTRHLSVVPDLTRIYGTDGKPMTGTSPPTSNSPSRCFSGFEASPTVWESFIIWLVDPTQPAVPGTGPPLHPEWPVAPANALPTGPGAPQLRYNSTIVLQSLQTGYCSPVLVLRRIETETDAVGMDGSFTDNLSASPDGEYASDLVSQLQKVAFEIYRPEVYFGHTPASYWLSCDQNQAIEKPIMGERRWSTFNPTGKAGSKPSGSAPTTPTSRFGLLPMTPRTNQYPLPETPTSPNSSASSDYFGSRSRNSSSSALFSPPIGDVGLPSTECGPIRRQRTGSIGRAATGPFVRPAQHRKRGSADVSANSSFEHLQMAAIHKPDVRRSWALSVGETCVWSIIGTEQITYSFYIPPHVVDLEEPISRLPSISRIIPPTSTIPEDTRNEHQEDSPATAEIHGKGFCGTSGIGVKYVVYYGTERSRSTQVISDEVMSVSGPQVRLANGEREVFLVREDGRVIVPTGSVYPV